MKKKTILIPAILISVIILTVISLRTQLFFDSETINKKESARPEHPLVAKQQEWLKAVNHDLGKFPDRALWKAFKQLEEQGKFVKNAKAITRGKSQGWYPIDDYFANLCISKLTYDPNDLNAFYFCTGEGWRNTDGGKGAGVWKSSNAGKTWFQLSSTDTSSFFYCQDMTVHPTTSDVYVATRQAGLQRSKDGGNTWVQVLGAGNGSERNEICDIELTKNGGIFVGIGITYSDGIYYSDNGNAGSWTKQTNGFPTNVRRIEIATAPSDDNIAYAIPVSYTAEQKIKGIFKTINKGDTWIEVSNPGGDYDLARNQGWYDLTIAVDPNDPNVVVAGGINLWKTTNGGNFWNQISWRHRESDYYVHVDQHEIVFINSDTVFFGNDGGVWKSDNFSAVFPEFPVIYDVNHTYNVTQFYTAAIHPKAGYQEIIGGTQDNGSNISSGPFLSDHQRVSEGDGSFCAFGSNNGNIVFTSRQYNNIYRSRNGDYENNDDISNLYVDENSVLFINPMELDPNNPEILYMASTVGLWRLKNASVATSDDWEKATRNFGSLSAIGISKSSPNVMFLGRTSGGNIFRVDNADVVTDPYRPVNIDLNGVLPNGYASCIYVDPKDANHLIVVYSNYGIESIWEAKYALTDSISWYPVEGDLPDIPIRWALLHPTKPEVCYIATELGVFYTNKLDKSNTIWLPSGNSMPNTRVDMLRLRSSDNTVVAATHGRGLFTGRIMPGSDNNILWMERGPKNLGGRTRTIMIDPNDPSHKTIWAGSVSGGLWKVDNIDLVDFEYSIEDDNRHTHNLNIFPNPVFNSQINLQYSLAKPSSVSISIYDISGKIVKILVDEFNKAGKHSISCSLSDENLQQGTYFVSYNAGDIKIIKKFVYFK